MTDTRLATAWAARQGLWAEGSKLWAEGSKLLAEGAKLRAEGDCQWAQAILDVLGDVPVEWHGNGDCTVGGVRYVATPTEEGR